ncbi:MAG: hypothetical protein ACHQIM_12030 [Sphingobacteriales bacterium]
MAVTYKKNFLTIVYKAAILAIVAPAIVFQSCKNEKKVYQSDCNTGVSFQRVSFTRLIDNIEDYDQKYIEVDGTYEEGKDESALVNDSLFVSHSSERALWVNFSQDCPLYLVGTRQGIFEYNDGKFTQLNNKSLTIRGKIDVRHKGHLGSYRGTIERVSFVKL